MSKTVSAIYRGPSGALLIDGHTLLRNEVTEVPLEIVERANAHTDHKVDLVTEPKASKSAKADTVADSVASDLSAHLEEGETPAPE